MFCYSPFRHWLQRFGIDSELAPRRQRLIQRATASSSLKFAEAAPVAVKRHELEAFSVPERDPRTGLVTVPRSLILTISSRNPVAHREEGRWVAFPRIWRSNLLHLESGLLTLLGGGGKLPKEEYEFFGHECVPWGPVGARIGSGGGGHGGKNPEPSITTTLRKKGALSTSPWRPAHALDSFVFLVFAKRFPAKN